MALATTTAEADARLVSKSKDVNVPGFTLKRMWAFIDATVADTLGTTLDAVATYTNPQADGQTYTGTFVNSKVELEEGDENNQRYVNIIQTLVLVTTVSAYTDLTSPTVLQKNEIEDLFGLATGEGDSIGLQYKNINPASNANCMQISDANVVTMATAYNSTQGTWVYADRVWEEKEDGTAVFSILCRIVTWNSWSSAATPDILDYGDVGSDDANTEEGETTRIKKTWLRIDNSDIVTAETECRDGTVTIPAGYAVTDIIISDNRDGSISVTQSLVKQIDAVNESGTIQLNPHGINTGVTTNVTTVYKNFPRTSLPSGTAATAGSDIISNIPQIQGDGLWSRTVITRVPTWDKTWADAIEMNETSAGGYRNQEHLQVTGVPESGRGAAYTAAKTASGATRAVVSVQQFERANGERVIASVEKPKNTTTDTTGMVVTRIADALGRQDAACVRTWWNHDSASTLTLTTGAGVACSGFTYDSITYLHSNLTIDDNGDGTYNIHQLGTIPSNSSSGFWGNDSGYGWFAYQRKKDEKVIGVEHLRTDTIADAYSFARGGTVDTHDLATLKTNVNSLAIPDWTGTPTVIGSDSGWQTGVWRRGKDMFFACRVVADSADLPIK